MCSVVTSHKLKSCLYLAVVEKKPSLLLLPLSLDVASFPFLCSKYPSGSELIIGLEGVLSSLSCIQEAWCLSQVLKSGSCVLVLETSTFVCVKCAFG